MTFNRQQLAMRRRAGLNQLECAGVVEEFPVVIAMCNDPPISSLLADSLSAGRISACFFIRKDAKTRRRKEFNAFFASLRLRVFAIGLRAKPALGSSGHRLLHDPAVVFVFYMLFGPSRAAPHSEIGQGKKSSPLRVSIVQGGQVDPRDGGVLMMRAMPIVIEPDRVQGAEYPEISCAARDMALGAIMVDVLHRRPHESETAIHRQVVPYRNSKEPDDRHVQHDRRASFQANPSQIRRIERLDERSRCPIDFDMIIDLEAAPIENERREYRDPIADHDQQIVQAGQDAHPNRPFPNHVVPLEIKVKGFVIGAVSEMMTDVTLAEQMKGRREK